MVLSTPLHSRLAVCKHTSTHACTPALHTPSHLHTHTHTHTHTPSHTHTHTHTDPALMTGSPQPVRRLRESGFHLRSAEPQRSSLPSIGGTLPKQMNWDPHTRGANRSVDSGVSSPGDQRSPEAVKTAQSRPPRSRHVYEDVERRPVIRHAYEDVERLSEQRSESRTSSWVNAHNELGWGKKEGTGSMWAPQNKLRRPRRQDSMERERDLTATVHNTGSYSQRSSGNTLPSSSSNTSPRRRVSYMSAMGGEPSEERFAQSFSDPRAPVRYSQSPAHRQSHRVAGRAYDSLQRPAISTGSSRYPRRGSESVTNRSDADSLQDAKAMLLRNAPPRPSSVQRTRSHGANRTHASGAERLTRTGSGRQLEPPYLKQSLL